MLRGLHLGLILIAWVATASRSSEEQPLGHVSLLQLQSGYRFSPTADFFDDVPAPVLHHLATKGSRAAMAEPVSAQGDELSVASAARSKTPITSASLMKLVQTVA